MDIRSKRIHTGIFLILGITVSFPDTGLGMQLDFQVDNSLVADEVLYVDIGSAKADDQNEGGISTPLRTIQEAADRAIDFKREFRSTRVNIMAGVYREEVSLETYTNYPSNDPNNLTPIWFIGEGPGLVKVSGADVIDNWEKVGENLWINSWLHDWGIYPDPTGGGANVPTITRRREMVFVGDQQFRQVEDQTPSEENTFSVMEAFDAIIIYSSSLSPNVEKTKVGIREELWKQEYEHNVTIRNIDFEYAATRWQDAVAAVRFAGSNDIHIENANFSWNNGRALYFTGNDGVTLDNVKMNDNGWDGWGTWKVKNFRGVNTETSRNNWRGHWGEYYRWSVGNKILRTHGFELVNHIAKDNYARGLWLDLDNIDVVIDGLLLEGNLRDGAFIEANQGPIHITKARICNNSEYGLFIANTDSLTITNSKICENELGEIMITGQNSGRWVYNFETLEEYWVHSINWKFDNVDFIAKPGKTQLTATTLLDFEPFLESLDSNYNTWCHPSTTEAISIDRNNPVSLSNFQNTTGQDFQSTWECPSNLKTGKKMSEASEALESDLSLAQKEVSSDSYSIYPNPSTDYLHLKIKTKNSGWSNLTLFDLQGREIVKVFDEYLAANETREIDFALDGLSSGNYILKSSGELALPSKLIQVQH